MIRIAVDGDFNAVAENECAIRIHALKKVYGFASFIRYYTDDNGGLMSIIDGTAVLYCSDPSEEWAVFITMNPDVLRVHCSVDMGRMLMKAGWQGREGVVLRYEGVPTNSTTSEVCENPYLPSVHALLCRCFEDMTSLNTWYPDVSHRIRHNCAHIATIMDGDMVVSTAMTVAVTESAAILGQVATNPDFRGRGYAKTCINTVILRCKAKTLYILPVDDFARSLYESMGFVFAGEWAELQRA